LALIALHDKQNQTEKVQFIILSAFSL